MALMSLEKFILAKGPFQPLPNEARETIKKFLLVPMPTARLIKKLNFTRRKFEALAGEELVATHHEVCVEAAGEGFFRVYQPRVSWSHPPLRPRLVYKHLTERDDTFCFTRLRNFWQYDIAGNRVPPENALELEADRPGDSTVYMTWPPREGVARSTLVWHSRLLADERRLLSLCP